MDLKDQADQALEETILAFRPNHSGSWKMIGPGELTPAIARPQEWMNFLGAAVGRFESLIAPKKSASAESFVGLYPKIFRTLRDKLADGAH